MACHCHESSCGCSCHETQEHQHSEQGRGPIIRAVIAVVLLAVSFLLPEGVFRLAFCLVAYLVAGFEALKEAVENIFHGHVFDENFLMTVASIGAFCVGEYYEGVAVMVLYTVGEWLQGKAVASSRASIRALIALRPDTANRVNGDEIETVKAEDITVGDVILVRGGERIPLDGVILEGSSMVDTSPLTGESVPREWTVGDEALSGCINGRGTLKIQVTKPFGESSVSRIMKLVEEAQENKAKPEQFITRFARVYTPVVCIAAVLLAVIPPLLSLGTWSEFIHKALSFLVISCPCALVISVPLSFFAGIGCTGKQGILLKGGSYLELLAKAEIAAFDKTGTLTTGVVENDMVYHDTVKSEAHEAVAQLRALGLHDITMLSGDKQAAVDRVAEAVGLDHAYAELLPEGKVDALKALKERGSVVYAGDGINDAPVLACADVGVAMGALGSDAAMEAADVVIMDDQLTRLPLAIRIARRTMAIARQNIVFSIAVKIAILLISLLTNMGLWLAVFADVGVCLLAVLNSLRVLRTK